MTEHLVDRLDAVVADAWAVVLGAAPESPDEDFFAAGGDSICAARLVGRLRLELHVDLTLAAFLEQPTAGGLTAVLEAIGAGDSRTGRKAFASRRRDTPVRASLAQERFWFIDQTAARSAVNNVAWPLRLRGPIGVTALERALAEVVRRHEVLRTRFAVEDGEPVQLVDPPGPVPVEVVDLSSERDRDEAAHRLLAECAGTPFDLERGPLLRVQLVRLDDEEHVLQVVVHHIVVDDWSMGILLRELGILHQAFLSGRESPLDEPGLQYADYADWQRSWLQGELVEREVEHWTRELAGIPGEIHLPIDRPRPASASGQGAQHRVPLPANVVETLCVLGRSEGASPFVTMLAAFDVLLYRYTGDDDLVVGTAVDNRNEPELEGIIGLFTNPLVVRSDLSGAPSFRELLTRVRRRPLDAVAHQDLPFDRLAGALPDRELGRHPVFQIFFEFLRPGPAKLEVPGFEVELFGDTATTAEFDLSLYLDERGGALDALWEYSTDLFDAATIERLGTHFVRLLEQVAADPDQAVSELPLLDDEERLQLLVNWNATGADVPETTIDRLFAEQARSTPEALALVAGDVRLTYAELNARANRTAHLLRGLGLGSSDTVGLCTDRSADMIVGLLGILKAGGAYVPLNADHPSSRLVQQLEAAGARVLLTQEALGLDLAGFDGDTVCLDRVEAIDAQPSSDPEPCSEPDGQVYVLYTSGSTGVPKGVAVRHRNLVNYTTHMLGKLDEAGSVEEMHFATVSAVSTDLGNTAIFPSLLGGGCLHIVDQDTAMDGAPFADYLERNPVDVLKVTPSHLRSLLDSADGRSVLPRRWLITGGEAATWELVDRVSAAAEPGLRILNHYGPTETTVGSSTFDVDAAGPRPASATVPIGRPISNTRVYLLDPYGSPVPVGVPGELFIGGGGVAVGYVGQPEVTAERFVDDPFSGTPGPRLYRTGDLARYLPDGTLEFLGRIDDQVKIRGFRVEPAEIEAALTVDAGVRQAVVLPVGDGYDRGLVAYVVPSGEGLSVAELRRSLEQVLPPYMVPSSILQLKVIPLTPSGKIDRKALLAAGAVDGGGGEALRAPRTDTERMVAGIWTELLGREQIGVDENFFEIGGHSLLTVRLIARLRSDFAVMVPLREFVQEPTIVALAARLEAEGAVPLDKPDTKVSIPSVPREGPQACSFAQEQFWFVDQLSPSAAYNFSWPLRLLGDVDERALEQSIAEVVRRHDVLRTRFAVEDGEPLQVIDPPDAFALGVVDLSGEADPEAAAQRLVDDQTRTPFDLARDLPLRVQLLRLSERDRVLQVVVHHIAVDGWSKVVLYRELSALYASSVAGQPSPLAEPAVQYADYALWQRAELTDEVVAAELEHWRRELGGAPDALDVPADRPRPPVASLRGGRSRLRLPTELTTALEGLSRREGATFFTALLALFDVFLFRYTGQEDLVVGTPVDGRTHPEIEETIGLFMNTVAIRSDLSGEPSFRELLRRVHRHTLDAVAHKDLPFEHLVRALRPQRDLSRHPLFQVLLAINPTEPMLELPGVEIEDWETATANARVDLFLVVEERPHGFDAVWEYSTDLFDRETIERMQRHFVRLLEEVVTDPERSVGTLPMLDDEELRQLLDEWNDTGAPIPSEPVHRLFAAQAAASPNRVAIEFEGAGLTYGELDCRANQLAHHLRGLGVGTDDLVAICTERSAEMVVGLLGILKAGGAYVPVDPAFPPDRQCLMFDDAQPSVVITEEHLSAALPTVDAAVVCLDRDRALIDAQPTDDPDVPIDLDQLAYVMYTSGSTGRPKGVEVSHRALANFLTSMQREPGLAREDVLVAVTTLSFDIAGLELYLPLICGARLVVCPQEATGDPRLLRALLDDCGATSMQATPTTWRMLVDGGWPGKPGLKALCGGEALPAALADELLERGLELWNMYGPTETTIWSTTERVTGPRLSSTIGRPIANTTVYVLDERRQQVPVGVPGELCIGGAGLARGYRGQPEVTAERFISNPFGEGRLYRTGDLARFRRGGSVEFLGRLDQQVKVRGFRIELGEIETRLAQHPGVAAAVAATDGSPGESRLVAYVVPVDEAVPAAELRRFLEQALPAYMVPSSIVTLDALPLTPNGKIDRKSLPRPEELDSELRDTYVAPKTELEAVVAGVWAELLGRDRVGVEDDFFELGGHSLLAARLVGRLSARFEIELPLRALFERPTVVGLADEIEARLGSEPETQPPPLVPIAKRRRCSFAQERFWFIDQITGGSTVYNIAWPLRLRGPLDTSAIEDALAEIVRRHETLRTRFALESELPVQVVDPPGSFRLEKVDLGLDPEREQVARRLVEELAKAPFDLEHGPLLRAQLLRLADDDHVLQVVVHHIAADGWSKVVFFRELGALYAALSDGRPSPLPEPPVQYGDFAEWQRSWLQGEQLERSLAYWRRELEAIPAALELPTGLPRPAISSQRGDWLRGEIPAALKDGLATLAQREGATLFMAVLAAFDVLLHRYTGQDDIVVGAPIDDRSRPELEDSIGLFVNTLPLRSDLTGNPTFTELLARVRQRTLDAIAHGELPFERLVQDLQPERDLGRHPVFQVMLAVNQQEPEIELPGLEIEALETTKAAARVDLTLMIQQRADGLDAVWEYSTDLFDAGSIAGMHGHLLRLLEEVVEDPQRPIGELPLMDETERQRVLVDWNDTHVEYPNRGLHELVEEQVERSSDRVAVTFRDTQLTYAELDERANRLAHRLRRLGVERDALVGICMERSLELVVGLLGILKAGGAYVPIDPGYPEDRLTFMLDDSNARVLLTQERLRSRLPRGDAHVVCLDRDWPDIERESSSKPAVDIGSDDLAYVIYTSGSTGRPKGAMNTHRAIVNRLLWMQETYALDETDSVLQKTPFSFDVSVWEFFWPLLTGSRLVMAEPGGHQDPVYLVDTIERERITTLHFVPSMLQLFVEAVDPARCGSVRRVICSGEALPAGLARRFLAGFDCELHNLYGPTEAAVDVTAWACQGDAEIATVPIGRPIANTQIYVLDAALEPVPVGVAGELYIGGVQVARGYLNRPELTSERFLDDPFRGGRLYRTGDLARWNTDGAIEFLGRIDDQIKIRGFRIELGEIEAVLGEHDAVADSVVVATQGAGGGMELAAYVVPDAIRAGVVRRLLRLEREEQFAAERCFDLPNGMVVAHANRGETEFLYDEVFVQRDYLQHGVVVPEDACVFDVGANIGMFSLLVGSIAPSARIFAFEPMPAVFELLQANAELYGLDAKLFDCGLAAEAGTASFTYFPYNSILSGSFADPEHETAAIREMLAGDLAGNGTSPELIDELLRERTASETVVRPLRSLSDVMAEHGVERIDLLKIDVETREWDVLAGIEAADWPKIQQLVVEVHDRGETLQHVVALLRKHGFSVAAGDGKLPSAAGGQCIVYAHRDPLVPATSPADPGWRSSLRLRGDVRDFLKTKLPDQMVPASFTLLEELPLSPNGKLDRKALPAPARRAIAEDDDGPRTAIELAVADVWKELLGVEQVGSRQDFFELGGHSILLAQAAARLRERFGIDLSLRTMFQAPTVEALAAHIDEQLRLSSDGVLRLDENAELIAPREHREPVPLSLSQQGLWLVDRLHPEASTYNVCLAFRLRGALDETALRSALMSLVERHEALRTVFVVEGDEPVCRLKEDWELEPRVVDLTGLEEHDRDAATVRSLEQEARKPFDLSADLLLRTTLLRLAADDHILVLQTHHIAFDAWSESILLRELGELYAAARAGEPSPLSPPPLQYGDFAVWQRKQLSGERLKADLAWWRERLAGAPMLVDALSDRPRPAGIADGATYRFELEQGLADAVRTRSRDEGVTPYILLLAVFATLLYRRTGRDDVVLGSPMANRGRVELENLVGFCSNTVVVRTRLNGNPTFSELLGKVREVVLDVHAHQEVPFELVVAAVRPEREAGANPLFQVNFRVLTQSRAELHLPGAAAENIRLDSGLARFDLALELQLHDGEIGAYFRYNTGLFEPTTIAGLATDFELLLRDVLSDPDQRLLSLELSSEHAHAQEPAAATESGIKRFREKGAGVR